MPRDLAAVLADAPSRLRGPVARGISAAASPRVDRTGGKFGAGIIRQAAVITRTEALGHGFWIDAQFLTATAAALNSATGGIKARFAHPSLSGDGLGTYLGRWFNATLDGDVVRADLHVATVAQEAPDGNLAKYILDLAETDPEAFGTSIVFAHDWTAEEQFWIQNGGVIDPEEGFTGPFKSPDPLNAKGLLHARLSRLRATDVVDTPAANPDGLFHQSEIPQDADALLDYALGRGPKPVETSFSIDPERLRGYLDRALSARGLEIVTKETRPMSVKPADPPADNLATVAVAIAISDDGEEDEEECPVDPAMPPADPVTPPAIQPEGAAVEMSADTRPKTGKDFLERFGDQGGIWFAQEKTWGECERLHLEQLNAQIASLKAENEKLKAQATNRRGASAPLSASLPAETHKTAPGQKPGTPLEGLALAAASIRLPGKKYD